MGTGVTSVAQQLGTSLLGARVSGGGEGRGPVLPTPPELPGAEAYQHHGAMDLAPCRVLSRRKDGEAGKGWPQAPRRTAKGTGASGPGRSRFQYDLKFIYWEVWGK